jgi:hypothetical protein
MAIPLRASIVFMLQTWPSTTNQENASEMSGQVIIRVSFFEAKTNRNNHLEQLMSKFDSARNLISSHYLNSD